MVTEAEEKPMSETVTIDVTPDLHQLPCSSKQRVTRNISEPVIGLQVM